MTRPLRISVLSWRDLSHGDGGGSEVFNAEVTRRLVERGHQVTIRCARVAGQPRDSVVDGVQIMRRGGRLTVYPRALVWLWRRRHDIDAVIDVINGLPFASVAVRRRGLVALIHHVHREQWHIIYPGFWGKLGWFVESQITPRLYRGIPHLTVSESSRSDLIALGVRPEAIALAHNGVQVPASAPPAGETPRLVVLSRLVPHKQIDHALAIMQRLRAEFPQLRLDIIGDGWWRTELERAATELGVTDVVTFHGHVTAEVRDALLAKAWVHVLPSVKEGWGLAVMEAAAQGTPTLAYRSAGGVRESVLDGHTGALAEDLDELTARVRELLTQAEVRRQWGSNALDHARQFSWEATTDAVEAALIRAVAR